MGQCTVLGVKRPAAREVLLDNLHRSVRAGRNRNKHAMVPTHQGVLTAAAVAAAAAAAVDASAAAADDVARGAVKPTAANTSWGAGSPLLLMMLMASAVMLATTTTATASAIPSRPAAAPLAVASRLYTCRQGMGATSLSTPRP